MNASAADARTSPPAGPALLPHPVLAEVVRSGFVESRHCGSLVVLAADGTVEWALGEPDQVMFPRSSNKPMQAAAMVRCGLGLEGELLALAAASHSGEPFHVSGVRRILAGAGLAEQALQTPHSFPLDSDANRRHLRAGGEPAPIMMNCSGKHAAMLAACAVSGWPTDTYLRPDHPLQRAVLDEVSEWTGDPVDHIGTDGCGAPLLAVTLTGLARAFRAFVLAEPGTPERRVADAMRAHPEYVGGTKRLDTRLMSGVPGVLAKGGAEGVQAVALPDGRAVALKVDDGTKRAIGPVLAAVLRRLGVDAPAVRAVGQEPVCGGGRQVGEVRPAV